MKKKNRSQQKNRKKEPFNIYAWMNKNKKTFAGAICLIVIVGLIAGLMV